MNRIKDVLKRFQRDELFYTAHVTKDAERVRRQNNKKASHYIKKRRKEDPAFRAMLAVRNRMAFAVRAVKTRKVTNSLRLIGCTAEELREYLECQFKPGMTWENHGTLWEIDHVKPCSAFNLADPKEQFACFHWSNLQPLTITENRSKSDSWQGELARLKRVEERFQRMTGE